MRVEINGEPKELSGEFSLKGLIEHFSLPNRLIAIELNKEVVRRRDWDDVRVKDADKIEIIHFVGGG